VTFPTSPFKQAIEITGPLALSLWVSSINRDMDIFATVRNIAPTDTTCWSWASRGSWFR
jgi:predicted acyl esterase